MGNILYRDLKDRRFGIRVRGVWGVNTRESYNFGGLGEEGGTPLVLGVFADSSPLIVSQEMGEFSFL